MLGGCKSGKTETCGSVPKEPYVKCNFVSMEEWKVFALEHLKPKLSSITIYLMVKPFLFPPWNITEKSPEAAGYPSKDTSSSFVAKNLENPNAVSCSWSSISYFVDNLCFKMLLYQAEDASLTYVKQTFNIWLQRITDSLICNQISWGKPRGCLFFFSHSLASVWMRLM